MAKDHSSRRAPLRCLLSGPIAVLVLAVLVVAVPGRTPAAAAASAGKDTAKVFEPGKPNRTPVGGPIPESAGKEVKKLGSEVPEGAKELAGKRSEFSRTFSTPQGLLFTEFSEHPINHQDSGGRWTPIDNQLIRQADGTGFRNTSGPVQVELPRDLSSRPARVESNGNFVEFALKGAKKPGRAGPAPSPPGAPASSEVAPVGPVEQPSPMPAPSDAPSVEPSPSATPQTGGQPGDEGHAADQDSPQTAPAPSPTASAELPPQASAGSFRVAAASSSGDETTVLVAPQSPAPAVDGETAMYREVFQGVDIKYTVVGRGLKEEIVLGGPDAPASYDFTLTLSAGSKAVANPSGGIDLVDSSGSVWAVLRCAGEGAIGSCSLSLIGGFTVLAFLAWLCEARR